MILLDTPGNFWDPNIINLINGIKSALPKDSFVGEAKEIAAFLALIYLSVRAYAMILGESKLEVMQLVRPFVISLVIINFGTYAAVVDSPGKMAGNQAQAKFEVNAKILEEDLQIKDDLKTKLFETLISKTNELKKIYHTDQMDEIIDQTAAFGTATIQKAMADLGATITVYEQLFWIKISIWLQDFVMWLIMGIFKGVCYCIFFVQLILIHILLILGPLSFAFSIAGAFRDSWITWTARYIAVSFYTAIGFIVLNIGAAIIIYGLEQENQRLNYVLSLASVQEQFIKSVEHIDNFVGFLLIAIFVVIAGIACVPVISTWIISSAGAGSSFFGTGIAAGRSALGAGTGYINRSVGSIGKSFKGK